MIVDDSPVEFAPWPDRMPSGYCYVGTPAWVANRTALIAEWDSMPPEFRAYVRPLNYALPNGSRYTPYVCGGPQTIVNARQGRADPPFAGVYLGWQYGIGCFQSGVLVHEWAHLIDSESVVRDTLGTLGTGQLTNRADTISLYGSIQPGLPAGQYAKTNISEWFAEMFRGWVLKDRSLMGAACEPRASTADPVPVNGALTNQARALFATIVPFVGMDSGP